jgi:DNA-binding LacI/PurR family transcriptional regulator
MSIREIARQAALSACTVSLALKNHPKIPPATRKKVQRIARRLGYRPNARVAELMSHIRLTRTARPDACLGVISLYEHPRPWQNVPHLERIYGGMEERAAELGYRLDPFWLREPGMSPRRLRKILDTRGIRGLLCFGSPRLEDELPAELKPYAIVTQGVSVKTPLHRIASNAYNDMWRMLRKVQHLGYKRPGLVLGAYEGPRSAHAYLCAYLGWCHLELGTRPPAPILQLDQAEEKPLVAWLRRHRPDVMIFAHHYDVLGDLTTVLARNRFRIPAELGVAVVTQILEGSSFSGLQANPQIVGRWAVELLVDRMANADFGFPLHPRIEMVDMQWVDGRTLRPRPPSG